MGYKIEQIEGIGATYAEKLQAAGIKTTEDLLEKCADKKGRAAFADLFRINGIAGQFAELLEAAGVDTVKELRHRVPANLHAKVTEVNEEKNLCNRVPSLPELEKMIAQAKELEPIITY